jgi:glutamine kinase
VLGQQGKHKYMSLGFGTKAETLETLESRIKMAVVLPQYRFSVGLWNESGKTLAKFYDLPEWFKDTVIVRSSGMAEDSENESLAGHFTSIGHVKGKKQLDDAIAQVIKSYNTNNDEDQVFIQPMLQNVQVSGVAFTMDPNNGGQYYVINYDDHSGKTNTITDGSSNDVKIFYCAKVTGVGITGWQKDLLNLLKELEYFFQNDAIDVEFSITEKEGLVLLQVRPLILLEQESLSKSQHFEEIKKIRKRINELAKPHPYLFGDKTIFGVMPDWNPAEIIGVRPRPLALSLYKELVTDSIWAYQRDNYGYRNLRSFPLLVQFSGLPYIDVRVSFNSFIPATVKDELASRLANHYIDQLIKTPSHHDKVEFEIIYSCYTLDLPTRIKSLLEAGFNQQDCDDLADSLRNLTNNIIHREQGLWRKDREKLSILHERQQVIMKSDLEDIEKTYWLIEDCKRYGTLPFAGLARAGFIAVQLLKSMVTVEVLTQKDYDSFMNSLDTIGSNLSNDLRQLSKEGFLLKYGHLRPGTYDILSPRYDEDPDRYFDWNAVEKELEEDHKQDFSLSLDILNKLESLLKEHRLEHDVISLFNFIKSAIEGREYGKFIFTKSLSDILSFINKIGRDNGFDVESLSYLDIADIKRIYSSSEDVKDAIQRSVKCGKEHYQVTKCISLPPLITSADDVVAFELQKNEPNYITLKSCSGKVVDEKSPRELLNGNILMILSADPGYDWVFSHKISGFITMYGGANSHMAIRAGELGMPAVIGAGESLYKQWENAKVLEIDCAQHCVHILQ